MLSSEKQLSIFYGNDCIEFTRVPRVSDINRVLIKVYPDCRIVVNAPEASKDEDVIDAVKKRARWIYKRLYKFKAQLEHVMPRQYVSGETHYYLGKQYLLKVIPTTQQEQGVKLLRGKLEVFIKKNSTSGVKQLLDGWYKERAREVFSRRLDAVLPKAIWVKDEPKIRLQLMKTQWGSCSPSGLLTLNPSLVKAPRECIDYVIIHELCHIAEHNHSEKFYRLMKQVMPKWQAIKKNLDEMSGRYICS